MIDSKLEHAEQKRLENIQKVKEAAALAQQKVLDTIHKAAQIRAASKDISVPSGQEWSCIFLAIALDW